MRILEPREASGRFHIPCLQWCLLLIALCLLFPSSSSNAADTTHVASPFGMTAGQSDPHAQTSTIASLANTAWSILLFEQHKLTQAMTGAVRNLKATTNLAAATGGLIAASFVYGILHAVGPGHGKAVISSYMLADKETLQRGIFLAFLSSLIQALSAIALIGGLYVAARATGLQTKWAEAWLETLSWGFVAIIGAWLMLKQVLPVFLRRKQSDVRHPDHITHDHAHNREHEHHIHDHALQSHEREDRHDEVKHCHSHSHDNVLTAQRTDVADCACGHVHVRGHDHEPKDSHATEHVPDEHCGHIHLPGPDDLRGELSWSKALAISFSIGIRPCTGALLVIVFAASQGLIWAGILATFAMAFGTALTVSALAAISVGSRNLAIAIAGAESRWGLIVARSASFISSAAVFVLGTAFFFASLHDTRPF